MDNSTDKFIIASFALWAGDFEYFEKVMKEYSLLRLSHTVDKGIESPEDVIRAIGALRLRQLWQKKGEFKRLSEESQHEGMEISDRPLTIETAHLRAAIWRTGERNFSMFAYLTDLSWEKKLFYYAQEKALKYIAGLPEAPMSDEHSTEPQRKETVKGLSVNWAILGNPFIQIGLSDLGMLEAHALWTEQRLPKDAEEIINPLLKVLNALEGINK